MDQLLDQLWILRHDAPKCVKVYCLRGTTLAGLRTSEVRCSEMRQTVLSARHDARSSEQFRGLEVREGVLSARHDAEKRVKVYCLRGTTLVDMLLGLRTSEARSSEVRQGVLPARHDARWSAHFRDTMLRSASRCIVCEARRSLICSLVCALPRHDPRKCVQVYCLRGTMLAVR